MPPEGRQFDSYLSQARSVADLAGMADTWAGSPSAKLRDQIAAIRAGLADVARVQAVVASLSARERATLALLNWLGGTANADALDIAVTMAGFASEPKTSQSISPAILDMLHRGLLLHDSPYSAFSWSSSYGPQPVFADARLLTASGPMMVVPLAIAPAPTPTRTTMRYGAGVVLDILAVLQLIARQGGLTLTQQGVVRAADQRRLARAMSWNDAAPFPDALPLLMRSLRGPGCSQVCAKHSW